MSPSGLNRVCRVIRFSYPADDAVGGAVPSGTVLYPFLDIRIEPMKPTQALVEQGVQVVELYNAMLFGGNADVHHNDQIEIILPYIDRYFGKKFRVVGVQPSSLHPFQDRDQTKLTLRHWDESHQEVYQ